MHVLVHVAGDVAMAGARGVEQGVTSGCGVVDDAARSLGPDDVRRRNDARHGSAVHSRARGCRCPITACGDRFRTWPRGAPASAHWGSPRGASASAHWG